MNSGLYAACAGLVARTQALDLAANNLANLNTNGFKAQAPTFRSLLAGSDLPQNKIVEAVNNFGVTGDNRTDLQQGSLEATGSDTDFAIEGSGFFVVQTGAGRAYTRDGNFHVDQHGQLATASGDAVLGNQGPILVPEGKLSVSKDGTISVDGALAGQLKLVTLPAASPRASGNSQFVAPVGDERPAPAASIVQGSLEGSNVNAISAAVGLVALQRNADMLQRALTTFHSDFNRIAAQDLSRV